MYPTTYKGLVRVKKVYQNTDYKTIKTNITKLMDQHNKKPADIMVDLDMNEWTVYSLRNLHNPNKPGLFTLMHLAVYLDENIDAFFEGSC